MLALYKVRDALCLNNINLNPQCMKKRKERPLENGADLKDSITRYKREAFWILI